MFIQIIKNWLRKEKAIYDYIKNQRINRFYRLYKLKAPDIVLQIEIKLIKETFLQYLYRKYIKSFIKNLFFGVITLIFPNFILNYILHNNIILKSYFK